VTASATWQCHGLTPVAGSPAARRATPSATARVGTTQRAPPGAADNTLLDRSVYAGSGRSGSACRPSAQAPAASTDKPVAAVRLNTGQVAGPRPQHASLSAAVCARQGRTLFLLRRAAVRAVSSDDDRRVAILAVRGALVHAHRAAAGARLRALAHPGARQRCLSSRRAGRPTYQDGLCPAGPGRAAGPRGGISATLMLTAIWEVQVPGHPTLCGLGISTKAVLGRRWGRLCRTSSLQFFLSQKPSTLAPATRHLGGNLPGSA